MFFFTLELARLVGPRGKVISVDVQEKMLAGLRRRAGKALLKYVRVTGLIRDEEGLVTGIIARDMESGEESGSHARVVVNATGASATNCAARRIRRLEPMITAG
jgi:glycerol-3-phosphate dehydrogenase